SRELRPSPSYTLFPYTTLFRSAVKMGLTGLKIAYVTGDDVLARLGELQAAGEPLAHIETGEKLAETSNQNFVTANVYLGAAPIRSEEHTSELQSRENLVCRLLL